MMIEDKKPIEIKQEKVEVEPLQQENVEVEPLQEEIVQPSVDKEETKRKGGKTCPICGEHFVDFGKLSQHATHHIDKTNTVKIGSKKGEIKDYIYGGVIKKYEQFHPDDVESLIAPLKRPYTKRTKEVVV